MNQATIALVFFFYGLAFFSMGLGILLERGRGTDARLRHALRPLAAFGFLHGFNEWLEMFVILGILPGFDQAEVAWEALRLAILAFSFLSLAAFGASLLAPDERRRRLSLLVPLLLAATWGFGLLVLRGRYPAGGGLVVVADVWTRYSLAIPGSLLASAGLVAQQRRFREAGMAQFGRDCLWAAIAFAWYGLIGQVFTQASSLPPSNVLNQQLFFQLFGFPVQILRGVAAVVASVFVIRFLRSFEVETRRQIAELQANRLREAERRENLRAELYRRVVGAQEAERQRIARELHDETGQSLTAIGMGMRSVASSLRESPEKAERRLRELENLVDRSLNELQRLIADLRPSHLDDLGLPATLRWYAGEIQARTPLKVSVEVFGEPRALPGAVSTALFRIAQEALTNVVRHAQANEAQVRLRFADDHLDLLISDDGRGFDPRPIPGRERPAFGLLGIEERATLLGGKARIRSRPEAGTQVEVSLPYVVESEEAHDESTASGG
ncbi:MAG TPA: sensor histidine kinase [Anaerolineales bacterium]|nr:sensor histidine kinase [Anaerolineales bacterium]